MHVAWAEFRNIRALDAQRVGFDPGFNVIEGENGAGKTTLMTCLRALSQGFATPQRAESLARDAAGSWSVRAGAVVEDQFEIEDVVTVEWRPRRVSLSRNGNPVSVAEMAKMLPMLLVNPHSHLILEAGPGVRRRYLDWGVFHMEHQFLSAWRQMTRCLRQRNAAIRQSARAHEIESWNGLLVDIAESLTASRRHYVMELQKVLNSDFGDLMGGADWQLELHPGWAAGKDYADALGDNLARDIRQGYTTEGPHRAELVMRRSGDSRKPAVSRGEQKLLVSALVLAQARLCAQSRRRDPVLLYDDLGAELSGLSREKLCHQLQQYPGQIFVTVLDRNALPRMTARMFHVEHGVLHTLHEVH